MRIVQAIQSFAALCGAIIITFLQPQRDQIGPYIIATWALLIVSSALRFFNMSFTVIQRSAPATMIVRDQKANGTQGGDSVSGANTRVLNTVQKNNINGASLASNQVTLPAGDYEIDATAPAFNCSQSKAYLYNVTDTFSILAWHKAKLDIVEQVFIFCAFFMAFAVKVPMWPVESTS